MDTPLACSLPPTDFARRRASIDQIARAALLARGPIENGARLTFADEAEDALRELIAAEAECCPFLHMELRRDGDALALDVTGPEDAQSLIAQLFA
jgi:MerR family transcriptional regulator, copper efflux regulator